MSDCTLGLGGEEKLEEKSIMEWNRLPPPSLSPSSKTPATSMIVAPWEQKAQWKHRGTHRRRESSSEGERPHEEEGKLSDSAQNIPVRQVVDHNEAVLASAETTVVRLIGIA